MANPGKYRHRLLLQKEVVVRDFEGGKVEWVDQESFWGVVARADSVSSDRYRQRTDVELAYSILTPHRVRINYGRFRIKWGDQIMYPVGAPSLAAVDRREYQIMVYLEVEKVEGIPNGKNP